VVDVHAKTEAFTDELEDAFWAGKGRSSTLPSWHPEQLRIETAGLPVGDGGLTRRL